MLRRLAHLFVIIALVAVIGGHWAILQSIAWTTMLADNLRTGSVTEAVSKTFDGEHPCRMCKAIKQGRADEQRQDQQIKPGVKLELGPIWQASIFTRTQSREWVPSTDLQFDFNSEGPPKPRPRAFPTPVIS